MSAPLEFLASAPTDQGHKLHIIALTTEGVATLRAALGDLEASYEELIDHEGGTANCEAHVIEEWSRAAHMLDSLVKGVEAE